MTRLSSDWLACPKGDAAHGGRHRPRATMSIQPRVRRLPACNSSAPPRPRCQGGARSWRTKGCRLASIPPAVTMARRQALIMGSGSAQKCLRNRWSKPGSIRVRQRSRSAVDRFVNFRSHGGSCREGRARSRSVSALLRQEAFPRLDADQIVDQLRRLARRRREFGSLGPAKIESADGALALGSESALVEGRETLAASRTAIDQAPAMTSAGHDAGAPPGPSEISRLVVGEALRAELQPCRADLVGPGQTDGMAKRQKQAPPISASDCHRRDPVAANAGLMMQQVQERRRRLEIEPRRPCAGAEPEPVPEMARRQAMSESETMQPARQKLVLRRDHLRRPAFGSQGREPRLHFDRRAGMSARNGGL